MKRILVTGAGGSAAYNFIESLRNNPNNEKFYIVGADVKKYHIELSNLDARYLLPPISDPSYLEKLNKLIEIEKIDFLHAQPDVEVEFISKNRDKVITKTFLPNDKTVDLCQNKTQFNSLLSANKISVPDSFHIEDEKSLELAFDALIINNERLWIRAIKGAGSKASLPIKKLEHGKMWIDYWITMKGLSYSDFMLSEFLPGKEYAFQSIWQNGKLLMSQARERVEYIFGNLTPSGQSSSPSVAKTVRNQELNLLVEKAVNIIDPNATGIFCADIKTDKDGKLKITEINIGRFFTTSYFFSNAGINMPYYFIKMGLGEEVDLTNIGKFDNLEDDIYWVRMIDMGYKLVKNNEWKSKPI